MSRWLPLMPIKRPYIERSARGGKNRAVPEIEAFVLGSLSSPIARRNDRALDEFVD
jgi:hypothetical protein